VILLYVVFYYNIQQNTIKAKKNPAQGPGCNPAMCAGPTREVNRGAVTLKADYERRTRKRLEAQNSQKTYQPPGFSKKRLESPIYPLPGPFGYHLSPLVDRMGGGTAAAAAGEGLPSPGVGGRGPTLGSRQQTAARSAGGSRCAASMLPPSGGLFSKTSARVCSCAGMHAPFLLFLLFFRGRVAGARSRPHYARALYRFPCG
jgi:hypothetical protein